MKRHFVNRRDGLTDKHRVCLVKVTVVRPKKGSNETLRR